MMIRLNMSWYFYGLKKIIKTQHKINSHNFMSVFFIFFLWLIISNDEY